MRFFKGDRSKGRHRAVLVTVGVTLFAVVLVTGLAFANSISVSRATENARALHWSNAALGTTALTRSALVQATTFTELAHLGLVGSDDASNAMADAEAARARLFDLLQSGVQLDSSPSLVEFIEPVDAVISTLSSGDYVRAKELLEVDLETAYLPLVASLQTELDEAQAAIDAHEAAGTRFSDFVRFFLTLAIPAAAVLIYRVVAKRQVREHQIKADIAVQAERDINKAKDSFIAGLSHELRTPLTSIYGFAEVLTDGDAGDSDTTREVSQIIANEAAEMTRMVDDLLVAARIETTGVTVETKPTLLVDVVESAITPFERAGLAVSRPRSNVIVDTDPARLRHIIFNLLSNAVRHGGSSIGVEISEGKGVVDIEVWDSGAGVPEDQLDKLFQRFVHDGSAPLLTGSVGLGLAVASCLASNLEGDLKYQRFNGKTYFTVSLPMADQKQSAAQPGQRATLAGRVKALTT